MKSSHPNLTRKEAAQHLLDEHGLPRSAKTLASYACSGGGPPFYKAGKTCLYPVTRLDKWAVEQLGVLRTSTSTEEAA